MGAIRPELQPGAVVPESEVVDLTTAINNQVEIMRNWERQFDITWEPFTRSNSEINIAEKLEKQYGKLADFKSRVQYVDIKESQVNQWNRRYEVKYGLSLKQAFALLEHYKITFTFKAYARMIDTKGRKVNLVKNPTADQIKHGNPRAGVRTLYGITQKIEDHLKPGLCNSAAGTAEVVFAGDFVVRPYYRGGNIAVVDDFGTVRTGIWHEVMEVCGLAVAIEAFYYPKALKQNWEAYGVDNFANESLINPQKELYDGGLYTPICYLEYDLDPKLGFGDPPPYSSFESLAYWWEKEAERSEISAKSNDDSGNYSQAANYWDEAQQAWLKALEAWQLVTLHPKRDERIKKAQERLDAATAKEDQARRRTGERALPTWQAKGGGDRITITYSDWPGGLKAKVKDQNNRVVDELRSSHPAGVVTWGEYKPSGLYFFVADTSSYTVIPRVLKAVLVNPIVAVITPPAPSWEVTVSGNRLTISYKDWGGNFEAQILDFNERNVATLRGTGWTGKISWGENADPGTYYVKVNLPNEKPKAVIITKKLEWSACVKFGTSGPYISITPKQGTKWPKGKGFGFSIHPQGSTSSIGYVTVSDSNQTGEVTWGKESGQKFLKWGRYTIWAYAKDPGLQAMFSNRSLCPNWRTDVEIPEPGFKVNGCKASVGVAASGPWIAPDKEQSLSIEYDNWPGKFKAKIRKRSSTQELVKLEGTSATRGSFTKKVTLPTRAYWIEARPYEGYIPLAIELTAVNP